MMFLVFVSCFAALATAQYPYNNAIHHSQQNQQQNNWQHNNGGNNGANNGAPVHYVNIGPQLQGDYKFGYNTGNGGSFREETRNPDGSVSGAYGYIDASGQQKVIKYTAGKDGFKAEGDDIPKAPPAPAPQAPAAPQHNYHHQQQPQQYQHQQPQQYNYQSPPQQYNQPQHSYNQGVVPSYSHNNYVQHQPNYAPANSHHQQQQQGAYNPFSYLRGPEHPQPNQLSLLSYNIGSGNNRHQG